MESHSSSLDAQDFTARLNAAGFTEGTDKLTFKVGHEGLYRISSHLEVTTQEVTAGAHTMQPKVAYTTDQGTAVAAAVLDPVGTLDLEAAAGTVAWGELVIFAQALSTITITLVSTDSGAVTTAGKMTAHIRITPLLRY